MQLILVLIKFISKGRKEHIKIIETQLAQLSSCLANIGHDPVIVIILSSPRVGLVVPLVPAEGLVLLQGGAGVEGRGRGGGEVDDVQVGELSQNWILTSL